MSKFDHLIDINKLVFFIVKYTVSHNTDVHKKIKQETKYQRKQTI